ncbi:hypothetical protein GAGA_2280 [Paraglaciecola agarilytica NO2]|uniref:Uncharacterized protein n=1 Tax=Paraglaciecola agarilytica NO2 TaxID=1125747 RepID=A0ABQ0I756_9ALTE|nr:hypothetical protein GAGA_2280 [Paraglaciecola agarilytica NO2]
MADPFLKRIKGKFPRNNLLNRVIIIGTVKNIFVLAKG